MNKIANYLKDNLKGEVSISLHKRQHFAGDASGLRQLPQYIISPYDEHDIRKVMYFSWQLAERGKVLPILARGAGTDMGGAAIGQPIVLNTQSHLNKIVEFNDKKGKVVVQPGLNFGKLHHILSFSHGRYIPAFPSSFAFSTIGGAIANNSGGLHSLRSGPMLNFIESLKVVLANGDVIETKRITKKEASKKMGLSTLEGEIYRAVDKLISENQEVIDSVDTPRRGGVGYNLNAVRMDNGSVDLTPLFVGAQGTLGVIVEATVLTEIYKPVSQFMVLSLRDRSALPAIVKQLLENNCVGIEYIDTSMLRLARQDHPSLLVDELGQELDAGVLVAEFNDQSERSHKKHSRKVKKNVEASGACVIKQSEDRNFLAQRLISMPHDLLTQRFGDSRLVPGIDDAMIPTDSINDFLISAEQLFQRHNAVVAVHVRPGDGIVHAYPLINLSQLGERQKLIRLQQDYYKLAMDFGGSVVGEHGAGRIRGAFSQAQLGDVAYGLMHRVKQIFDPYGILNPGVKIDVDQKAMLGILGTDLEITQLYQN